MGENGVAYWDTLASDLHNSTGGGWVKPNEGEVYRNDGVDLALRDGMPVITDVKAGEWWRYTVIAAAPATYDVAVRFAGDKAGAMTLDVDGRRWPAGTRFRGVPLRKGNNVIVLRATADGAEPAALVALPAGKIMHSDKGE
ncbi:hypothetical protein AB5I41_13265 [Sphingomonas sp. MMS24-JH45]